MNERKPIQGKGYESFRSKMIGHAAGILLMIILFGGMILLVEQSRSNRIEAFRTMDRYGALQDFDFGDPIDYALFQETLSRYYPAQAARNDSVMRAIMELRQQRFSDPAYKSGSTLQGLTISVVAKVFHQFMQFVLVYGIVLVILYYAIQRIALFRFITMKQHRSSYLMQAYNLFSGSDAEGTTGTVRGRKILILLLKALLKGAMLMLLFSPAYVIAYSVKTSVETSSWLFMIFLAITSNGVLIHTANRFYTLLVSESRKGYVHTAVVKNLHASYEWDVPDGIPLRVFWQIGNSLKGHILHHSYLNARFQFLPVLKEHAAFLITGLIIIEMALNIQGHLCYELMQQILYRQYDVVALIVLGIFLLVKATEIGIDLWYERERKRYGY